MHVEVLSSIPMSGSIRERHFNASPGRNAWVRFDDGIGDPWVGVFGLRSDEYHSARLSTGMPAAVAPFSDDAGRTVLVIAGTHGYVVDAVLGVMLRESAIYCGYNFTLASPPARDFVLLADEYRIHAVYRDRDVQVALAGSDPDDYVSL
ncbi:MAG: hypothetical protein V4617_03385 [Gemmatimonadota bacterium]